MRDTHAKAKAGMVSEIADLPLSGYATYANVAGLRSRKMTEGGLGILEKRLDRPIDATQALRPYLGGMADEAIYGRKINNIARSPLPAEHTSVHELYAELYLNPTP